MTKLPISNTQNISLKKKK